MSFQSRIFTNLPRRLRPLIAAIACLALPAHAGDLVTQAKLWLDGQVPTLAGDVEIAVGEPDARLALAECSRMEPFIPPNARLWGKSHVGVRCTQGATWTAYVPIQVRVFALSPVATRPLARGEILGPSDYRLERIELTLWPLGELAAPERIDGRVATRSIAMAEPIRRGHLKLLPLINPGDAVKVVIETPTFQITTEGKALTTGGSGEGVQVSLATGKTVWGTANQGKVVTIR